MLKKKYFLKVDVGLMILLLFAAFIRLVGLGVIPDGIHQDEAYAAYNAWGLMTEGIDSWGYSFPVYFTAWGSGQSALYTYLVIPLFKLLGVSLFVYRLPQALLGVLSIYFAYALGKELFGRKFGYLFAFVLAINPWHIMNTRFGLDANLAPGMFLAALYFFVIGLKKQSIYVVFAAVFWGLTLYSYALTWLMVPSFLVLAMILFWKKIPIRWQTILAVVLLFFMALPLILFLAVNLGIIPEMKTAFISIPKLIGFRGGELSLFHIKENLSQIFQLIFEQFDGHIFTSSKLVGAYYFFTTPFWIFGVFLHCYKLIKDWTNGNNSLDFVWLIWFGVALGVCSLNAGVTTIHFNMVHMPIIFYGVYGIYYFAELLKNKLIINHCVVFWCLSFLLFGIEYMKEPSNGYYYNDQAKEVLEYAKELASEEEPITIYGWSTIKYSVLLWYELPRISHFSENVVYTGLPQWREIETYEQFRYIPRVDDEEKIIEEGIYILPVEYIDIFLRKGFSIEIVNQQYAIAR